jgi:hypothetical protein
MPIVGQSILLMWFSWGGSSPAALPKASAGERQGVLKIALFSAI